MLTALFDTETTGLVGNSLLPLKQQPEIIEFYGVIVEGRKTIEELHFLCKPQKPITEEITKITTISNDDVADCSPFKYYAGDVRSFFGMAERVVAHNLLFDKRMVEIEFARLSDHDQYEIKWPPIEVCTVLETEWIKGHRLKLSDLYLHLFEEPFDGAHRANVDVAALRKCWDALLVRDYVD